MNQMQHQGAGATLGTCVFAVVALMFALALADGVPADPPRSGSGSPATQPGRVSVDVSGLPLPMAASQPDRKVAAAAAASSAASQPASAPDSGPVIRRLIQDLGAARFDLREQAGIRLRQIGEAALPALVEAATSDDPEIRVRAQEVLADVKLGIQPDWPADIVLLVRHYDRLPADQKVRTIYRISDSLKDKAAAFLLTCVAEGNENEAAAAAGRLMQSAGEAIYVQVVARIPKPANTQQVRVLAWALSRSGHPMEALAICGESGLDAGLRTTVVAGAMTRLREQLEKCKFAEADKLAAALIAASPDDPSPVYLLAEVMIALGRDDEAALLRDRAFGMNANNRVSHYVAGELLSSLGRRALAVREWEACLKNSPDTDVYAANCLLHMGAAYRECRLYAKASANLRRAVEMLDALKAAHGGAVGVTGGTVDDIRLSVDTLAAKARKTPAPPTARLFDRVGDDAVGLEIEVSVKGDKTQELADTLAAAQATVTADVKPAGLHLFDDAPAGIEYDSQAHRLWITLNGQRCSAAVDARLEGDKATVVVRHMNCYYVFEVDATTGQCKRTGRFEKNYRLHVTPGRHIAGYSDVKVKIADTDYAWADLLKGVTIECLTDPIRFALTGTKPSGKPGTVKFTLPLREPDIRGLAGKNKSPAGASSKPDDASSQPDGE